MIKLNFVDENGNPMNSLDIDAILNQELHPPHSNYTQDSDFFDFLNPIYKDTLSAKEKNIVYEMFSTLSALYRSDYKINNKEGRTIWNKVVISMPKCERRYVYRYLNEYDKMDLQKGEELTIEHSLTTTKMGRNFRRPSDYVGKYIIRCKSPKYTKGHDVSILWSDNYAIMKREQQINFEECTSFCVDKVNNVRGKLYIYMHEI